jgi:ribonuclease G
MTRKRTRESIGRTLCEPCFYCEGHGQLKSTQTLCYEILREIQREQRELFGRNVLIQVHPHVAARLLDEERASLERLEESLHACFHVQGERSFHLEQYQITLEEN